MASKENFPLFAEKYKKYDCYYHNVQPQLHNQATSTTHLDMKFNNFELEFNVKTRMIEPDDRIFPAKKMKIQIINGTMRLVEIKK